MTKIKLATEGEWKWHWRFENGEANGSVYAEPHEGHAYAVAICPRYERAHDAASLNRAMGDQAAFEAAARVRLNLRHDDESRRKAAARQHNDQLLADARAAAANGGNGASPEGHQDDGTAELLAREAQASEPDDAW